MKIHYALYDPKPSTGGYWTWFSPALTDGLCDSVRSAYLAEHLGTAEQRAELTTSDIFGGIIRLQDDWTVVYRVLTTNRKGVDTRYDYVLITAWIETSEANGVDLSPILTSKVFQNVAVNCSLHPVPQPTVLTEVFSPTALPAPALSREKQLLKAAETDAAGTVILVDKTGLIPLLKDANRTFTGTNCAKDAAAVLADVPFYRIALIPIQPLVWVEVEKTNSRDWACVNTKPNAVKPVIEQPPKKAVPPNAESKINIVESPPKNEDWVEVFCGCRYSFAWLFLCCVVIGLGGYLYGLYHDGVSMHPPLLWILPRDYGKEITVITNRFKALPKEKKKECMKELQKISPPVTSPPTTKDEQKPKSTATKPQVIDGNTRPPEVVPPPIPQPIQYTCACPRCDIRYTIQKDQIGTIIECQECKLRFVLRLNIGVNTPTPEYESSHTTSSTQCPHCLKYVPIQEDQFGKYIRCPKCGNDFKVKSIFNNKNNGNPEPFRPRNPNQPQR